MYSYIWNEYLTCGINEPVVTIKIKRGYSELVFGNDGNMGNNANFNNGNCLGQQGNTGVNGNNGNGNNNGQGRGNCYKRNATVQAY